MAIRFRPVVRYRYTRRVRKSDQGLEGTQSGEASCWQVVLSIDRREIPALARLVFLILTKRFNYYLKRDINLIIQ